MEESKQIKMEQKENITFKNYENFVEENKNDLKNLYDIFNLRIENTLSYKDFTKFCYVKTYHMFS